MKIELLIYQAVTTGQNQPLFDYINSTTGEEHQKNLEFSSKRVNDFLSKSKRVDNFLTEVVFPAETTGNAAYLHALMLLKYEDYAKYNKISNEEEKIGEICYHLNWASFFKNYHSYLTLSELIEQRKADAFVQEESLMNREIFKYGQNPDGSTTEDHYTQVAIALCHQVVYSEEAPSNLIEEAQKRLIKLKLGLRGKGITDVESREKDYKTEQDKRLAKQQEANKKTLEAVKTNHETAHLFDTIGAMRAYGQTLGDKAKGKMAVYLAETLEHKVNDFIIKVNAMNTPIQEKNEAAFEAFKASIKKEITDRQKELQAHRKWKPYIANILLALTGIGLAALLIKAIVVRIKDNKEQSASFNKYAFFGKTHCEQLAKSITTTINSTNEINPFIDTTNLIRNTP